MPWHGVLCLQRAVSSSVAVSAYLHAKTTSPFCGKTIIKLMDNRDKKESLDKYLHKYAGSELHRAPDSNKLPIPDLTAFSSPSKIGHRDGSNL